MDIVLFGIQWSGKWTQAQNILTHFPNEYVYFEPGWLFRALSSTPNCLGTYVGRIIDQWKPVHDGVTTSLFDATLYTLHAWQSLLIDGFPRKPMQYQLFLDRMQKAQREFMVIHFILDESIAVERMLARWRHDDTPQKISNRIKRYYDDIAPIVEDMKKYAPVHTIDAEQSIEQVRGQIIKILT
jgi:adenylate kinase